MECVSCNLCGADDTKLLFKAKERDWGTGEFFNIVRCNKCNLVYVNPRPDKDEIKKYYPPETWSRAKERIDFELATINDEPWQKIMKIRTSLLLKYIKSGRILDVGCGDGFLLRYLKEKRFEVYGVEPGEVASRYAREVLGLNIFIGNLEDTSYSDNWFDAVSLYSVFEHLPDPIETLKEIKRILKPDGILFISVPNFASFELKIFRERWVAIKPPVHFYHFTPATLTKTLERAGFNILEVKCTSTEGKYIMGYSESLRYLLMDVGLYPEKKNLLNSTSQKQCNKTSSRGDTVKKILHNIESVIFTSLSLFIDRINMGGNIKTLARKR